MDRAVGPADHRDRGSGTVLVVALVAVVLVLAAAVGGLARAQGARGGAQTAADLAALAAATSVAVPEGMTLGPGVSARGSEGAFAGPCALAREVAARNAARLTRCEVRGGGVIAVTATRTTVLGPATATSRAGPATARENR